MEITYEITDEKNNQSCIVKIHFKYDGDNYNDSINEVGIFRTYVQRNNKQSSNIIWDRPYWLKICKAFGQILQYGYECASIRNDYAMQMLGFMTTNRKAKTWLLISLYKDRIVFQRCITKQCQVDLYKSYKAIWSGSTKVAHYTKNYKIKTSEESSSIGHTFTNMANNISNRLTSNIFN